jgi:hypothetical protein
VVDQGIDGGSENFESLADEENFLKDTGLELVLLLTTAGFGVAGPREKGFAIGKKPTASTPKH